MNVKDCDDDNRDEFQRKKYFVNTQRYQHGMDQVR